MPPSLSFSLLFAAVAVAGSSASALELSLADIAPRVRHYHPDLQAARLTIQEARGRQLGAGRLSNPTANVDFQNESQLSPRTTQFALDQAFPLTGRLRLEKRLSTQQVEAAELEVRDAERRRIGEARELAVRLLALEQQRRLRDQQIALAQKLAAFVKERAAAGELSSLDAAQAQLDAQRLRLEARRLENEAVGLRGALKPMLGLSPETSLALSGELPPLTLPARQDWQQRADYVRARTQTAAALTETELARARRWQDISAGVFIAQEQQDVSSTRRERTGFVGVRLSIPLPWWNRNQGEIAEKTASAERARLETEALGKRIASEADTARREMAAQADLAHDTREQLLPLVMEQVGKLEQAYETGQTDLLSVLRAREQRLQLEAAALDAARDFHLARIRYDVATDAHP